MCFRYYIIYIPNLYFRLRISGLRHDDARHYLRRTAEGWCKDTVFCSGFQMIYGYICG